MLARWKICLKLSSQEVSSFVGFDPEDKCWSWIFDWWIRFQILSRFDWVCFQWLLEFARRQEYRNIYYTTKSSNKLMSQPRMQGKWISSCLWWGDFHIFNWEFVWLPGNSSCDHPTKSHKYSEFKTQAYINFMIFFSKRFLQVDLLSTDFTKEIITN
jgi:hypothetical protein